VNWNLERHDGNRADEHPSFQFYVKSLGDVPAVGDYVSMPTWNHEQNRPSSRLVKVTARRVLMYPPPEAGRYEEEDEISYIVTLMVEIPEKKDMPDFRP
jgi:hypothetical protein